MKRSPLCGIDKDIATFFNLNKPVQKSKIVLFPSYDRPHGSPCEDGQYYKEVCSPDSIFGPGGNNPANHTHCTQSEASHYTTV